MATGISSVATLSTIIGLPVSIPLDAVSFAGANVSGVTTVLTKKYQKKLTKVTKLTDIITSAIAIFEMSLSKVLNNGKINKKEFQVLQELHPKVINELVNVGRKLESQTRNQFQKNLLEEINQIRKTLRTRGA